MHFRTAAMQKYGKSCFEHISAECVRNALKTSSPHLTSVLACSPAKPGFPEWVRIEILQMTWQNKIHKLSTENMTKSCVWLNGAVDVQCFLYIYSRVISNTMYQNATVMRKSNFVNAELCRRTGDVGQIAATTLDFSALQRNIEQNVILHEKHK